MEIQGNRNENASIDANKDEELTKSFRFQNREILDNYVVLAVTDIEGTIKHVSTNLCNIFEYKESELLGKPYNFLIQKDSIKTFDAQFHDALISKSVWKGEMKHASKGDKTIWTDTIIRPLLNDEGNLVGFVLASNDITQEKKLKKIHEENMLNKKYDKGVLDFMPSLSSAVLLRTASGLHKILWIIFFTVIVSVLWASLAEIDELVKAEGKIIPSDKIQSISSFEGGILDEILVEEGEKVKKGQPLAKLHDISFTSEYDKNRLRLLELKAKAARLKAEASSENMEDDADVVAQSPELMRNERNLFVANKQKLDANTDGLKEKLQQRKNDLTDAQGKLQILRENHTLLKEEIKIKEELANEGIISKIDLMQQRRAFNDLDSELKTLEGSIPTIKSSIIEIQKGIDETVFNAQKEASSELAGVDAEIKRLIEVLSSLDDKVQRTLILSPVDGIVKNIYIKTLGSSVQAGKSIIDIVPTSDYLIAEVKVFPSDIGFLYVGQKAKLKPKAYDFAIYGGMDGEISYISADTLLDDQGKEEYYVVHVKSSKDYVGDKENLRIKAGMTVEADIITGKKTVMDYILKPILKTKQGALTEK